MSDPTARRGDNITALLDTMKNTRRGWSKFQMKKFLLVRYRYGVRKQTIDAIIQQLLDNTIIIGKPIKPKSSILLYFPNPQAEEI
jgi:hypothetical protein